LTADIGHMDTTDATDTAAAAHLHWCEMRNLSPETLRQRRDALRRLAAVVTDPATADEGDLACWWESIAHLHPQSRTTYLAHVRGFYRWATIEGLRADDPTRRLMRPRIPRAVPRPVSDSDVALALAATSDRVRPWVALAAFAGLRCAEIAGLRGEEVHRDADPPVVVVATGKGDRDRVVPWAATLDRFVAVPRHGLVFARLDVTAGPEQPWAGLRCRVGGATLGRDRGDAAPVPPPVRDGDLRRVWRHPGGAGADGARVADDHGGLRGVVA